MEQDRPDRVADRYEDLLGLFELEWRRDGHQGVHFGFYDDEHDDAGSAVTNTTRQLAGTVGVEEGDRLLDVGCGAGGDAVWLARAYDATVVGIDLAEDLLQRGAARASDAGVDDRVSMRVGDYHDLEAIDETVDVVWAMESLSHAADVERVCEGARSVLAPGGRVAIADVFRRRGTDDEAADGLTAAERDRLRAVEAAMDLEFRSVGELTAALEEAGFDTVEHADVTAAVQPGADRSSGASGLGGSLARAGSALGLDADAYAEYFEFRAGMGELMDAGTLGYSFVTATVD